MKNYILVCFLSTKNMNQVINTFLIFFVTFRIFDQSQCWLFFSDGKYCNSNTKQKDLSSSCPSYQAKYYMDHTSLLVSHICSPSLAKHSVRISWCLTLLMPFSYTGKHSSLIKIKVEVIISPVVGEWMDFCSFCVVLNICKYL